MTVANILERQAALSYPSTPLPGTTGKHDGTAILPVASGYGNGAISDVRFYSGILKQPDIWDIAYGMAPHPPVEDTTNCYCDGIGLVAGFNDAINSQTITVTFTNTTSSQSSATPTYLVWDFGDGTEMAMLPYTSSVSHQYSLYGTYPVCLTAYYDDGCNTCTDVYCESITILSPRMAQPDKDIFTQMYPGHFIPILPQGLSPSTCPS